MLPYRRFRRSDLRLTILTVVLAFACGLMAIKKAHLNYTAYAYTFSLGHGVGFVTYTDAYNELPECLKRSVELHEAVHLQDGTWKFWASDAEEIAAYTAQVKDLELRIEEAKRSYRMTGDSRNLVVLHLYKMFKAEVKESMRTYQK